MMLSFLLCARMRARDRHTALVPRATRDLIGVSLASPLEYADFIRQTSQEIRKFAPEFMSAPRPPLRYELRYEWNDPERNASIRSGTKYGTEVIVACPDSSKRYSDNLRKNAELSPVTKSELLECSL